MLFEIGSNLFKLSVMLPGKLYAGFMNKQRSDFVPEITAQNKQAGNKHHITDEIDDKVLQNKIIKIVLRVRSQPSKQDGEHKHDQTDAVASAADLLRRAVSFQQCKNESLYCVEPIFAHDGNRVARYRLLSANIRVSSTCWVACWTDLNNPPVFPFLTKVDAFRSAAKSLNRI